MSWLFSRALVEAYLPDACLDGQPSAPLREMPTAQKFWRKGKTTPVSNLSRYGLTCAPLTPSLGEALLTSCQQASRAKTSAQLIQAEKELMGRVRAYGKTLLESSRMWNPATFSSRTAPSSCGKGSKKSWARFTNWGLMLRMEYWELTILAPRTFVSDFGLWDVTRPDFRYPTLLACNYKHPGTTGRPGWSRSLPETLGGPPNPNWLEWFMGWPIGWTELEPLATDKFQSWRLSHGGSF